MLANAGLCLDITIAGDLSFLESRVLVPRFGHAIALLLLAIQSFD